MQPQQRNINTLNITDQKMPHLTLVQQHRLNRWKVINAKTVLMMLGQERRAWSFLRFLPTTQRFHILTGAIITFDVYINITLIICNFPCSCITEFMPYMVILWKLLYLFTVFVTISIKCDVLFSVLLLGLLMINRSWRQDWSWNCRSG